MRKIRKVIWIIFILSSVLSVIPFKLFGVNISLSDILYGLAFYLIVIERFLLKKQPLVILQKRYTFIWLILFFIGIGTFFGLIRAFSWAESISYFLQYIFVFVVLLTVIDYLVGINIKNAIKVLGIWLIPHVFSVILNFLSSLNIYNGLDALIKGGNGRYVGLYGIATSHGLNMTYVVVISILFFAISKKIKNKTLFLGIGLGAVYSIALSGSFSAVLLLVASIMLVIWFCLKQKVITRALFILFLLVSSSTIFLWNQGILQKDLIKYTPDIFAERLERSNGELGSADLRMDLNRMAIEEFTKNPIFGVGADQFNRYNAETRNVHNTILSSAVETGVFGLIGVLIYLLTPLIFSRKLVKADLVDKSFGNTLFMKYLFVLAVMRIAQTMFSGPYIQREAWIPFLLIFALYSRKEILSTVKQYKKSNEEKLDLKISVANR